MTFDWQPIRLSKSDMRRSLASVPIEEKLAMLDVLRERLVAIQNARRVPVAPLAAVQAALEVKSS
jgi:hypothetical protein